jgi:hypothetical protein
MKNIASIINIVKIAAVYGAYLVVIVEGLKFIADGWEKIDQEKNLKNESK